MACAVTGQIHFLSRPTLFFAEEIHFIPVNQPGPAEVVVQAQPAYSHWPDFREEETTPRGRGTGPEDGAESKREVVGKAGRTRSVVGEEEEESRSGYKYAAPPAPNVHLRTDQTGANRGASLPDCLQMPPPRAFKSGTASFSRLELMNETLFPPRALLHAREHRAERLRDPKRNEDATRLKDGRLFTFAEYEFLNMTPRTRSSCYYVHKCTML